MRGGPLGQDRAPGLDYRPPDDGGGLGALVRFHRKRLLWTQRDLARVSGVSARTVSDLERGVHASTRLSTIAALADALRLNPVERQRMMSLAEAGGGPDGAARPGGDNDGGSARSGRAGLAAAAGDWLVAADEQRALVAGLDPGPGDDEVLCDALLELGRTSTLAMRRHEARPAYLRAARLAMQLHDRDRLVVAAAGYAFMTKAGDAGPGAAELWRTAQLWIRDEDVAARSILVAAHACACALDGEVAGAADRAELALVLARRSGDPDATAVAISVVLMATRGWPNPQRRLELGRELAAIRGSRLDHVSLAGVECQAVPSLELGDRDAFAACVARLDRAGRAERHPFAAAQATVWAATLAMLDGDAGSAERLSSEGVALAGGAPNFSDGHVAQVFSLLRMQGRSAELYDAMRSQALAEPDEPAWRAAYLTTAVAAGDPTVTSDGLERMRTELWPLPRTRTYPVCLAFLAEAAFQVGDDATARLVEEELTPYAGTYVVVATATSCEGPVDHYRAMAAATSGDVDRAAHLCRDAFRQACRLRSGPLVRRTEELQRVLA